MPLKGVGADVVAGQGGHPRVPLGTVGQAQILRGREVPMTEVPGTDRDQARDNVLHETPLVPESVEDAEDDTRSTDEPTTAATTARPVRASSRRPGAQS
jgi:hypothetical protein